MVHISKMHPGGLQVLPGNMVVWSFIFNPRLATRRKVDLKTCKHELAEIGAFNDPSIVPQLSILPKLCHPAPIKTYYTSSTEL